MIFSRRQKRAGAPPHVRAGATEEHGENEFHAIDFDMMLKGRVIKRRGGPVRQVGVTVDGSTRLVTSGDVVDRDTYEALLASGAVQEPSPTPLSPQDLPRRPGPPGEPCLPVQTPPAPPAAERFEE